MLNSWSSVFFKCKHTLCEAFHKKTKIQNCIFLFISCCINTPNICIIYDILIFCLLSTSWFYCVSDPGYQIALSTIVNSFSILFKSHLGTMTRATDHTMQMQVRWEIWWLSNEILLASIGSTVKIRWRTDRQFQFSSAWDKWRNDNDGRVPSTLMDEIP